MFVYTSFVDQSLSTPGPTQSPPAASTTPSPTVPGRCAGCSLWSREPTRGFLGRCGSWAMAFETSGGAYAHLTGFSGATFVTRGGQPVDLFTGEKFGCVHFKPR
jgi:hypothetical protein